MSVEGLRKIAEGREAEIFAWDGASVLKLYRSAGLGHAHEIAAFEALRGTPGLGPALREAVEIDGRPGIVMERVEGSDMLALIERAPWRMFSLARALAEPHARIHEIEAPGSLTASRSLLALRLASENVPADLRPAALRELEALPDGDRLCHGDFHPGNVLVSRTGVRVIDWNGATRGDPAGDFARSALLMRIGDPPPGTSKAMRALVLVGRSLFARPYASRYLRLRPVAPALRRSWEIVHAAARFAEGIEVEFKPLEAFLRSLLAKGSGSP